MSPLRPSRRRDDSSVRSPSGASRQPRPPVSVEPYISTIRSGPFRPRTAHVSLVEGAPEVMPVIPPGKCSPAASNRDQVNGVPRMTSPGRAVRASVPGDARDRSIEGRPAHAGISTDQIRP